MRRQVQTGAEGMLGKKGLVIEDIDPEGKIQYATETWCAMAKGNKFSKGDQVKISGTRGLMLLVEKIPADERLMERKKGYS